MGGGTPEVKGVGVGVWGLEVMIIVPLLCSVGLQMLFAASSCETQQNNLKYFKRV